MSSLKPVEKTLRRPYRSFRELLLAELKQRQLHRPDFSLRSFAKLLDLEPSFLSKILSGKRPVTQLTIQRSALKLKINKSEIEYYTHQISTRSLVQTRKKRTLERFKEIPPSQFSLIAEWYFAAILEASTIEEFDATPHWITKNLKIDLETANKALKSLEAAGYLIRDKLGKLRVTTNLNSVLPGPISTPELMRVQKQFLNNSLSAIDNVPVALRDHSALVFAMPSDRVPEAKRILKSFRRKFLTLMQRPGRRDAVFQVAISFSPLTMVTTKDRTDEK